MRKYKVLALILWISTGFSGLATAQDFSKLDQFLDSLQMHDKFMGNILLSHEDKVIYERSIGFHDSEAGEKLTEASRFRVGSISKMFTTSLVLKSVEEGKLSLEQPLSDFYPQVKNAEKITISHLLQHRSGIHNFTNDEVYMTYYLNPQTEEFMVEQILAGGSDFEPDSKGEYSNSNFVLLTYILEKVNHHSYADLIKEYITSPLRLKGTYVGKAPEKEETKSYKFGDGKWVFEPLTDMSVPAGAGAIVSTTTDLAKFIEVLYAGKIVSEESLGLMMEMEDGFGRGMFQFPYGVQKGYGHNGGIDGFHSHLSYFPEEKLSVVSLSNGLNFNSNEILLAVLDSYFGKEVKIPNFSSVVLSEEDLDEYVGVYASEQIPLVITFVRDGNVLIAKPSGQPDAPLEAKGEHRFEFAMVGAIFEFAPETGGMTLKQGGASIAFRRK